MTTPSTVVYHALMSDDFPMGALVTFLAIVLILAAWFGGMQYADRDAYKCQYVGGITDSTLFEAKFDNTHKILVKGNHC